MERVQFLVPPLSNALLFMKILHQIDTFHQNYGYAYQEIEGLLLPLHYTHGVDAEIALIQSASGVIDLTPFHLISVAGPEAQVFLQGMVSNDVQQIQIGQLQPSLLSTHKGKILYQLAIARVAESTYFILTRGGEGPYVGGHLDHFHIREDLEMELLTPHWLRCDVLGPSSVQTLRALGYADTFAWNFQNHEIKTLFSGIGNIAGFVNMVPEACYVEFLQALLNTSDEVGLVGFEALDEVRIDQGVPRMGVDFGQEHFPQEAALLDHVSYQKGCYVGQETHARMYHRGHPNWQCVGIGVPAHLQLDVGQKLFEDDEVGTITSLSRIVHHGTQRGIAFVKYSCVQKNATFALKGGGEKIIPQFPLASHPSP